jgi:ribosomal protein S12 methylthiotransferase
MSHSRPLTISLVSLGCPKNLIDSEKMLAHLADAGMIVGAPMEDADVIIVNTCGFLAAAREESLGVIREAIQHKDRGRARRVVVAGCLVNRERRKLLEIAPGIDAIVDLQNRDEILFAVRGRRRVQVSPMEGGIASDAGRFRLTARHTAYLRISEGCSQKCTFCTIPTIRGPYRSKKPADVLAEAQELLRDGAVELNIIGQDTTSYGLDLPGHPSLAGLLRQLGALPGARWIRLMYAYPRRFTDAVIDAIAETPAVAHYVDLPLQHIADRILKRMGRQVTRKATEDLLDRLRKRIPGMAIRTTFIVGFPGEGEAQFAELLDFVESARFDAVGIFEYSPEEHTPAAAMDGQTPPEVARQRASALMAAQRKVAMAAHRHKLGESLEILVDGHDHAGRCIGRYYGQAPEIDSLCILTEDRLPGMFIRGEVVGHEGYDLVVEPD